MKRWDVLGWFLLIHKWLLICMKLETLHWVTQRKSFNQCCGSGMFIPDPWSWFLPIPDPGSKISNKREGWKKINCHTFICCHKFHKIDNYFIFAMLLKKIWTHFQRIIEYFTQKIVTKLSKIWVWDPGSEIRKTPIPDPGVKKTPDPGSGSAILLLMTSQLPGSE